MGFPAAGGGGTGIPSGTSMPSSPTTNQQIFRTDLGLAFYYDGTRWLSMTQYNHSIWNQTTVAYSTSGMSVPAANDLWLVSFFATTYTGTTGASYVTWNLNKITAALGATNIATFNTSADTAANWVQHSVAVGAVVASATYPQLNVTNSNTGTPGTVLAVLGVNYRLIGV